jgi:2-dehydropantoate 2-reductase
LRVAVIGAGAIGGPIAAHIAENDLDITIVTKHPDLAEKIQKIGIKLVGNLEKPREIPMKAVPDITDLQGQFEIIFMAMKGTDVLEATKKILPYMFDNSVCVTLQNGIVEDFVAEIIGRERVIGAVAVWTSTMIEPGVIQVTTNGSFHIGLIDETGNQQRLQEVAELLQYCQPVIITDNIFGSIFSKLVVNVFLNGVNAICGLSFSEMFASSRTRLLCMGIITEAVNLANHLDIQLDLVGRLDVEQLTLSGSNTEEEMQEKHSILEKLGSVIKEGQSSTLQSLKRGRKTEVDLLNGYISNKGAEVGIPTPINAKITQIIKEIEARDREISPENLLELPLP